MATSPGSAPNPEVELAVALQREHIWILLACLVISAFINAFGCREVGVFYRRRAWLEVHWAYSVAVINLFFLQMVYIAVETGQLVFELNRTLGVSSLYVETTRWRVALHFLVLGVGGVAELFFLWRACLVMNTALPKLIGVALFLVCAGLYFTSNVLTALGLGDPRMEHLGNKVRCGATWSLLVLGIYATAWLWYRLVLSRRDRRASTTTSIPSPVDIIAQGILYTSAVLTTLSLCATVSSSFYSNPHAIMITSAILNIYTPFACFCVTWAINQRPGDGHGGGAVEQKYPAPRVGDVENE